MNMDRIYERLQEFFANGETEQAEDFLIEKLKEAQEKQDMGMVVMLLNEMIGLCRETGQAEKSLGYAGQALSLMEQLGWKETEAYATTLLNAATACRAAGKYEWAYQMYMDVFPVYEKCLPREHYLYASLYNNMSLLFQETGEYERALECQGKALVLIEALEGHEVEVATSHANIATTYCVMAETEKDTELAKRAMEEAKIALDIYQSRGVCDVHVAAAMTSFADSLRLLGQKEEARSYYQNAMDLVEKLVGRTQSYDRIHEKLKLVNGSRGMEMARAYYEEVAKDVLKDKFPELFEKMAIGLCGEGSECLGFDDEISMDHDFGPGFVIWLSDEDYEKYGVSVSKVYDSLPKEWNGYIRKNTANGAGRVGVTTYASYFERILGISHPPKTEEEWLLVKETSLRTVISGEIFHDPQGIFTDLLDKIKKHYPKKIAVRKKMQEFAMFEQCGLYNYPRMIKRGDFATANLLLAQALEHASNLLYLSKGVYAPHKKWLLRGLKECKGCEKVLALICETAENLYSTPEVVGENLRRIKQLGDMLGEEMKEQLVDEIVKMEWEAFDKVKNEGGRAGCQDDFTTFEIMRKSQYLTWTAEMLMQYREDFAAATTRGWNPITEKYARMMESTAPAEYEKLRNSLPKISQKKREIMEGIISIQVSWMEAFAKQYPKMAGNARVVHTYEDTEFCTSYETYLRGEIATYSDTMLLLYGAFVAELAKTGKNLAYLTMEHTACMYGYTDVETAERKMW